MGHTGTGPHGSSNGSRDCSSINITQMVEELCEAAQYEDSECGEYWELLCNLWQTKLMYRNHTYSFSKAIEEEIAYQHQYLKDNFTLITHEAKTCDKCGVCSLPHKELVWNDDLE